MAVGAPSFNRSLLPLLPPCVVLLSKFRKVKRWRSLEPTGPAKPLCCEFLQRCFSPRAALPCLPAMMLCATRAPFAAVLAITLAAIEVFIHASLAGKTCAFLAG